MGNKNHYITTRGKMSEMPTGSISSEPRTCNTVFQKMLGEIIGLTAVTMETRVSGVNWQLGQFEGWLTSKIDEYLLIRSSRQKKFTWHMSMCIYTI